MEGKKTYIAAAALALASFALALGWLTREQFDIIQGVLASLGLAALRAGVTKS
jgi:hypothetical protein